MKISEADYIEWFGVKGMKWKNHVYVTKKSYDSYKHYSKKDYQAEKKKQAKNDAIKAAKQRRAVESSFKKLGMKPTKQDKHSTTYKINNKEYVVPKANTYRSVLSKKDEKAKVKDYIKKIMSSSSKPSLDEANKMARDYVIQLRKNAVDQSNSQRAKMLSKLVESSKATSKVVAEKNKQLIKANYSAAAYKKKQKKSKKVM